MHVFEGKKLNFHFLNSLFSGIGDETQRTKELEYGALRCNNLSSSSISSRRALHIQFKRLFWRGIRSWTLGGFFRCCALHNFFLFSSSFLSETYLPTISKKLFVFLTNAKRPEASQLQSCNTATYMIQTVFRFLVSLPHSVYPMRHSTLQLMQHAISMLICLCFRHVSDITAHRT